MNKFDTNELINCFKMTVDLKGIKKLEEYIKNLEQENNQLKEQRQELRSWLEQLIEYYDDSDVWRIERQCMKDVLSKLNELEGKNE